ncbi:antitermination protein [Escherichia coli DEC11C]|nr:antitermination protein [Escherichia coli DEC11C]
MWRKGEVSTACKDCRGRGVAIHREESVKTWYACYQRLPALWWSWL